MVDPTVKAEGRHTNGKNLESCNSNGRSNGKTIESHNSDGRYNGKNIESRNSDGRSNGKNLTRISESRTRMVDPTVKTLLGSRRVVLGW